MGRLDGAVALKLSDYCVLESRRHVPRKYTMIAFVKVIGDSGGMKRNGTGSDRVQMVVQIIVVVIYRGLMIQPYSLAQAGCYILIHRSWTGCA